MDSSSLNHVFEFFSLTENTEIGLQKMSFEDTCVSCFSPSEIKNESWKIETPSTTRHVHKLSVVEIVRLVAVVDNSEHSYRNSRISQRWMQGLSKYSYLNIDIEVDIFWCVRRIDICLVYCAYRF